MYMCVYYTFANKIIPFMSVVYCKSRYFKLSDFIRRPEYTGVKTSLRHNNSSKNKVLPCITTGEVYDY